MQCGSSGIEPYFVDVKLLVRPQKMFHANHVNVSCSTLCSSIRCAASSDRVSALRQQALPTDPACRTAAEVSSASFSLLRPESGLGLSETGGNWCGKRIEEGGRADAAELKEVRVRPTPTCARALIATSRRSLQDFSKGQVQGFSSYFMQLCPLKQSHSE